MPMHPLYSISDIRSVEAAAQADLPCGTLMQRAGFAAATAALALLPRAGKQARVLILTGPGNNGGDALEAAAHLAYAGVAVCALDCSALPPQSPEAIQAMNKAQDASVQKISLADADLALTQTWDLIIDGIFGIGLSRPIDGDLRDLIMRINRHTCPILALDVPSGLHAKTGALIGDCAIRASHTITFIADKTGLHTCDGRDHAGHVQVAALGLVADDLPPVQAFLNQPASFPGSLQARRHNSHKGSYGDVAIVGGASGMAGAAILAARAALHSGAGRVFATFIDEAPAYDSAHPEIMCRSAVAFDFPGDTIVIGPGLGSAQPAQDILARALDSSATLVLDADALNQIAADPTLQQVLRQRSNRSLLTPHPLEAARLLGCTSKAIQDNRLSAARNLARRFNAIVILKGSGSVIARPDGKLAINPSGNPGLATAGSGDVLAGICGALLAQHWPAWEAALAAVWLHGRAADELVEQGVGPIGLCASELSMVVRMLLNRLQHQPPI